MKKIDPKIVGWLKLTTDFPASDSAQAKLRSGLPLIKGEMESPEQRRWLDDVAQILATPIDDLANYWWRTIREAHALGFPKTAAYLTKLTLPRLAQLPLELVAHDLPDGVSLEAWRKAASVAPETLRDFFLSRPAETLAGAGVEWLLAKIAPIELAPLFRAALSPNGGAGTAELLLPYLKVDPKGKRLEAVLAAIDEDEPGLKALARSLRQASVVRLAVLDSLGWVAQSKRPRLALANLVGLLFEESYSGAAPGRRAYCGELARLLSGLLMAAKLSPAGLALLDKINEIADHLRNTTRDPKLLEVTWAPEHLGRPTEASGTYVTLDGARRWALAYEDAVRAGAALGVLEALGLNLGLGRIAEIGQPLSYSPLRHEDVSGGLLPNDPAVAVTCGWHYNQRPIIRAKVKKTE